MSAAYTAEEIADAIHGQESGGAADARTSVTGASGGWQIEPATFRQYAQPGESISNPADNEAVGRRIIASHYDKFGGDPGRIATAYFSGPGNVAPEGSATPYLKDRSDPTGKTVSSYVSDVLSRLPARQVAAVTPGSPPPQSDTETRIALARQAGFSHDEIAGAMSERIAAASAAGFSKAEITAALGPKISGYLYPQGGIPTRASSPSFFDKPAANTYDYFSSTMADAFDSAFQSLKKSATTASGMDLLDPATQARIKSEGAWGPVKQVYDQFVASGHLPVDAFNMAFAGLNGAINAVYTKPVAGGLEALGAPKEYAEAFANASLLAVMPEAGEAKLSAIAAEAAPPVNDVIDARVALANTGGNKIPVADSGHITQNVMAEYAKTGEAPASMVRRAQQDPELLARMQAKNPPAPIETSDIENAARRVDPETFQSYDRVTAQIDRMKGALSDYQDARMNSPEGLALQKEINDLTLKQEGRTDAEDQQLEAATEKFETFLKTNPPEVEALRDQLAAANTQLRGLLPDMANAYKEASRHVTQPEPFTTTPGAIAGEHEAEVAQLNREAAQGAQPPGHVITYGGIRPVEGTGETVPYGLSQNVAARAVEERLTETLGNTPMRKKVNFAEQGDRAAAIDYQTLQEIASGRRELPKDLLANAAFTAAETAATIRGDTAAIENLVHSPLALETTTKAQDLGILATRGPISPIEAIKGVQKARAADMARQGKALTPENATANVKSWAGVKEATASKQSVWEKFAQSLPECPE